MNNDARAYTNGEEKREPILRIWREIRAREQGNTEEESAEDESAEDESDEVVH